MAIVLEFPRPDVDAAADAEIVSILTGYSRRAQCGDIRSLVLAVIGSDGHPECAIHIDRADAVSLIGMLRVAESRIGAALDAIID